MIYSMGEMLIDFMQEENGSYIPYPGGAPANVAAHAKRSGANAVFVGKISTDNFGELLTNTLEKYNILFPLERSEKNTALAIISHVNGERSFQFYRNNTADLDLNKDDIDQINFNPKDILHFCSLGLVPDGSTYDSHQYALETCRANGGIISFDVNLREKLWSHLEVALSSVMSMIPQVDIIKVNESELTWLTGTEDIEAGLKKLQTHHQLVICTMGSAGSILLNSKGVFLKYQPPICEQVDTTGAGDSYIAMILASLEKSALSFIDWQAEELEQAVVYASKISAQVVMLPGAIPAIQY